MTKFNTNSFIIKLLIGMTLLMCVMPLKSQERITIGAEIWIEPGQTKEEIYQWFKTAAENKMYSIRLFMMWNYIETSPGNFDFTLYDWAFEAANKYNINIEATLCAIHGPVFVDNVFQGRPQFNELFSSHTLLDKAAVYISKTVCRYRNNKSLGSWWILNEPRRFDPNSELAIQKLQEWVQSKYKSIDVVNKAWIQNYADFSDIKYNPLWSKGSYFYWPTPSIDWYQFQRDFLTYNLNWIANEIRKHDKTTLITLNPANVFESAHQYDLPVYKVFNDVLGASMHASWQLKFMDREQYGYAVAGISEILRGAAPDGKFWISELQGGNNIWSGKTPMCPDSLDLAQWIWTGIGSGARKVIYWALNYRRQGIEAGEWGLFGFRGEPTDRSRVTYRINEVIEKNNTFFKSARPYKSKITLILSPETMRVLLHIDPFDTGVRVFNKDAHVRSLMMWFVALSEIGYQVEIKYLSDYDWDSTEQGRVVILANAISIPQDIIPKMEKFVANGNELIAEGLTGFFDEYETNSFQTGFDLENLLGARMVDLRYVDEINKFRLNDLNIDIPAVAWKPFLMITSPNARSAGKDKGDLIAVSNKFGKGNTLWIPPCFSLAALSNNTELLSRIANFKLDSVLKEQPFYFKKYVKGSLLRILENEDHYVTVINNNNKHNIIVNLENKLKLTPTILFGRDNALNNSRIRLSERETLVILWRKNK